MSAGDTEPSSVEVCASCGIAAIDDIRLNFCDDGCELVKYCSDGCQENHREKHEEECNKRKAELHDKQLFTLPGMSYMGECPLCCLPLPIDLSKSITMSCCCKTICNGCCYANEKRENEQGLKHRCAFCREPKPKSGEEVDKNIMERVKKNDPVATTAMGKTHDREGDYEKAVEYHTKAAELGHADAHACLGNLYWEGKGVENDMKKAIHHLEQAAIGGHTYARYNLADYEITHGRYERAAKHYIINANLGCNESLKAIKVLFVQRVVSKDEYTAALRGYQAAVNETKSAEREKAEAAKFV
jgi:tetratricopeptide (TPR) repeat protein